MWMFIHLLFIEQCHNRLLVLTQWLRSYFTGARSARLIEGASGVKEVLLGSNGDDGVHPSPAPQVGLGRSRPVGATPDTNGGPA